MKKIVASAVFQLPNRVLLNPTKPAKNVTIKCNRDAKGSQHGFITALNRRHRAIAVMQMKLSQLLQECIASQGAALNKAEQLDQLGIQKGLSIFLFRSRIYSMCRNSKLMRARFA
jgi:hypothetical protein